MRYIKYLTVKEYKKFDVIVDQENGDDITMQEIIGRQYDIILTDHRTRKDKFNDAFDKVFKADINKTLNKVTKHLDDFSKVMSGMKGIGGKPKDLSGLFPQKKNRVSVWRHEKNPSHQKRKGKLSL